MKIHGCPLHAQLRCPWLPTPASASRPFRCVLGNFNSFVPIWEILQQLWLLVWRWSLSNEAWEIKARGKCTVVLCSALTPTCQCQPAPAVPQPMPCFCLPYHIISYRQCHQPYHTLLLLIMTYHTIPKSYNRQSHQPYLVSAYNCLCEFPLGCPKKNLFWILFPHQWFNRGNEIQKKCFFGTP